MYFLLCACALLIGLGWMFSALQVFYRDISHALTIILNLWFWVTPIVWSPELIPIKYRALLFYNPIYYVVEGYRGLLIFNTAIWPGGLETAYFWSVGDAKFQNKCFMHFKSFQAQGKTIIFVSHSTETILRNCTSALLIDGGRLIMQGKPQDTVDRYFELLFPGIPGAGSLIDQQTAVPESESDDLIASEIPELSDIRWLNNFKGTCERRNSYNKNEFRFGKRKVEVEDYSFSREF